MNVVLITDLYPIKDDETTTPRTLYDFVQGWKSLGCDVSVVKPNFMLNSMIRKKPFYKTGIYGEVRNLNFWLPFIKCKNVELSVEDKIYVAHMPSGILYAESIGVEFVAGIHQSDIDVLTKPLYRWYFGKRLFKALRKSRAIACRSEVLKRKLLNLYPEFKNKTFICPSGIDETKIEKSERMLPETFEDKVVKIITVANFIKRKNIDKVINAVKGFRDFELTIIGDGKEARKLKNLAKGFDNISFLGALPNEKVLERMRESDIFILPSVNETFGMVYLEAMASGCITVGTMDDGIDGIIENGRNGYLVKPNSQEIKSLLMQIKNIDKNSLNALRKNSFDTICQYTKSKMSEEYLKQILSFCNDLTT